MTVHATPSVLLANVLLEMPMAAPTAISSYLTIKVK